MENTVVVRNGSGEKGEWDYTIRGSVKEIFVTMEWFCVLVVALVT